MAISLADLYKYSKLSTAGYIDLTGAMSFTAEELRDRANRQARMPVALGSQLFTLDGWTVLGDPRHPPGTSGTHNSPSGLAATLFSNTKTGEKVLSVRGTEGSAGIFSSTFLRDLQADVAEIGGFGVAMNQLVDLFNLVQRMRAGSGTPGVLQLTLKTSINLPPAVLSYTSVASTVPPMYIWLEGHYNGVGVGGLSPTDSITVVGHSLGGHLAAMLHRLMPQQFSQAVVFNSARFDPPTSAALTTQFLNLFSDWGATPSATFSNVQMFDSEDQAPGDDVSVVSSLITGTPFGPLQQITMESNSHVIEPLMDSLSLQALMAKMKPGLTLTEAGRILQAMSNREGNSDESLLRALYKALKGNEPSETDLPEFVAGGTSAGGINQRQKFYERLLEAEAIANANPKPQLTLLLDTSAAGLKNLAVNGDVDAMAYRYALRELNPFAILGNNALLDSHNANGQLELYNATTRTGTLTNEWLEDRTALLAWKNIAYTQDTLKHSSGVIVQQGAQVTEAIRFTDLTQSLDLGVVPPGGTVAALTDVRRYVFGGDGSDNVVGGVNADRLYGGGGTDYMIGMAGNDYLEGGKGLDIYEYHGRAGLIGSNDGVDCAAEWPATGVSCRHLAGVFRPEDVCRKSFCPKSNFTISI